MIVVLLIYLSTCSAWPDYAVPMPSWEACRASAAAVNADGAFGPSPEGEAVCASGEVSARELGACALRWFLMRPRAGSCVQEPVSTTTADGSGPWVVAGDWSSGPARTWWSASGAWSGRRR